MSIIRNPVFRVIQRILRHIVLCRHESSNVRVEKLNLLWGMLNDDPYDLAYALLKQLKRLEGQDTGLICIRGMLTPLITHFLEPRINQLTPLGEVPTLDIDHLCQMKILTPRKPPFFLRQRSKDHFPLPNPALTMVTNFHKRRNWLLLEDEHRALTEAGARGEHRADIQREDEDIPKSPPPKPESDEKDAIPSRRRRRDTGTDNLYQEIHQQFCQWDAQMFTMRQDISHIRHHQQEHMALTRQEIDRDGATMNYVMCLGFHTWVRWSLFFMTCWIFLYFCIFFASYQD